MSIVAMKKRWKLREVSLLEAVSLNGKYKTQMQELLL